MKENDARRATDRRGLWLGQALALGFLAACLWRVVTEAGYLIPTNKIAGAITLEETLGATLIGQLAAFGATLLLVHSALGLAAFGLARLTEAAFPGVVIAKRAWLVTGWFAVLTGLVMAANATWHPASIFAESADVWRLELAGLHPVEILALAATLLVAVLVFRACARLRLLRPAHTILAGAGLLALVTLFVPARMLDASTHAITSGRPNVVIIGIDSLRNDLTIPMHGPANTPQFAAFLGGARRFNDATTPLARTYPSWMSILTGRHPVTTNARYNLMPRRLVHEGETLAGALRHHGYQTLYATDEVRFANIDESFGFDQCITPPIGAIDFLLGLTGDVPLVNLVASTPLGGLLFPSNHANRAAYITYRPADFVRRLDREFDVDGPAFIAIHLTLSHWPYSWAGRTVPASFDEYRTSYGAAVGEVDRQFGEVMRLLGEKGVLENAVVVLLSDHGEALGANGDSMLRKTGTNNEIWETLWGHGTSVMSPNQYQVLLAMRTFGHARLPGPKRDYDWPVSLEDVRPTLEEVATGLAPTDVDGISLLPYLAEPGRASTFAARVRFTETDFNTPSTARGKYNISGVLDEASYFYEIDHDSGWVQLRSDRLHDVDSIKQRAALSSDALLAYIPTWDGLSGKYLFTSRRDVLPRRLEGRPDPASEPEAARLWDALMARFPGELPAESQLPRL